MDMPAPPPAPRAPGLAGAEPTDSGLIDPSRLETTSRDCCDQGVIGEQWVRRSHSEVTSEKSIRWDQPVQRPQGRTVRGVPATDMT